MSASGAGFPVLPRVLCQPGGTRSCGACCGLYNRRDRSEAESLERLWHRTLAYRREADIDDAASLAAFRAHWEAREQGEKVLGGLPNCPFLGLLELGKAGGTGEVFRVERSRALRVGCLVHPLQNDGTDGRDCGVYDRDTCEDYLCASHDLLTRVEKRLVLETVQDSYLYGLTITDVRFVRELLARAAGILGFSPPERVMGDPGVREAALHYFACKRDWPYRDDRDGIFGQVVAGEGLQTSRRLGPSAALGVTPDHTEAILTCLATQVESLEELLTARVRIQMLLDGFASAVTRALG